MTTPDMIPSPWVQRFDDYLNRAITMTLTWSRATNLVTGLTVVRDPGCLFGKLLIGVGPDGTPDTTSMAFAVPEGTTNVTVGQLNARGITTIQDVMNMRQITAGV